jgi:Protein of unknown function (DUF2934)
MTKKGMKNMTMNPNVKGSRRAKRPHAGRRVNTDHDMERWLKTVEHDLISRRAREIFFERGSKQGQDLDNWLRAEAEVKRTLAETEEALKAHFTANNAELNGNN